MLDQFQIRLQCHIAANQSKISHSTLNLESTYVCLQSVLKTYFNQTFLNHYCSNNKKIEKTHNLISNLNYIIYYFFYTINFAIWIYVIFNREYLLRMNTDDSFLFFFCLFKYIITVFTVLFFFVSSFLVCKKYITLEYIGCVRWLDYKVTREGSHFRNDNRLLLSNVNVMPRAFFSSLFFFLVEIQDVAITYSN